MLFSLLRWIFEKFAAAALIVALGLVACGLWLFLKDNVDFELWRQDVVRAINGERAKVQSALDDVHKRLDRQAAEITAEQERGRQADKIIAQLRDLESTWDRLVGNPEQQKSNAAQLEKITTLRVSITAQSAGLQREFTRTQWERDGLEIALGKIDARLQEAKQKESRVIHYLERSWEHPVGRAPLRWPLKIWVYVALGFYFIGPSVKKIGLYFFVAPYIARGRPVRLQAGATVLPEVGAMGVSVEVALRGGERLWIKEKFLQSSDEGLRRKTRYLLDWRVPLTCFATNLVELIELSNGSADGAADQRLTLSNQTDAHSELAVLSLDEGASIVLRPSFLAGVVTGGGRRLVMRRRWQMFRWQSWVSLQFRYFEFVGPCRLIVAGNRGVRAERLTAREGDVVPARRTNQDATIGFTPDLDYRPVRAETFWSYYRGMNPLFDDLFAGRGIFLCQQVSTAGDAKTARALWSGVWGGVMKVFGM
ncbi:MAG: hypothetical protein EXS38_08985 [Opitutus sp.]|nr:hypothetical protein [Opitutus sp.]